MANGANSQQKINMGQLLFRHNKKTGRLDTRVISISSISDKMAEGQRVAYKSAMAALAESAEAVGLPDKLAERPGGRAANGAAAAHAAAVAASADAATAAATVSTAAAAADDDDSAGSSSDLAAAHAAALAAAAAILAAATAAAVAARAVATAAAAATTAAVAGSSNDPPAAVAGSSSDHAADAADFFERWRELKAHLRNLTPVSSMNDRAANGRKAARLVRGAEAGDEMPTCAEHAGVNIGEAGMKAMDALLRSKMNITDETAAADKDKIMGISHAIS